MKIINFKKYNHQFWVMPLDRASNIFSFKDHHHKWFHIKATLRQSSCALKLKRSSHSLNYSISKLTNVFIEFVFECSSELFFLYVNHWNSQYINTKPPPSYSILVTTILTIVTKIRTVVEDSANSLVTVTKIIRIWSKSYKNEGWTSYFFVRVFIKRVLCDEHVSQNAE